MDNKEIEVQKALGTLQLYCVVDKGLDMKSGSVAGIFSTLEKARDHIKSRPFPSVGTLTTMHYEIITCGIDDILMHQPPEKWAVDQNTTYQWIMF